MQNLLLENASGFAGTMSRIKQKRRHGTAEFPAYLYLPLNHDHDQQLAGIHPDLDLRVRFHC
jgi:hypothetical protein